MKIFLQISWCYDIENTDGATACYNFCGGTIYNKTTIITAAHCCAEIEMEDWPNKKIVAGELDILESSGFEQTRKVKSYAMHPDYDSTTMNNDICLLFLDSPLTYNSNVKNIAIDTKGPGIADRCVVSGWGALYVSFVQYSSETKFSYCLPL